jgi:site-specific recombinase XerD
MAAVNQTTHDEFEADLSCSPKELRNAAKALQADVIPIRSCDQYQEEYARFCKWRSMKLTNVKYVSDTIIAAYYKELQSSFAPTSLFSKMSRLKKMLFSKEGFPMTSKCWSMCTSASRKNAKQHPIIKATVFEPDQLERWVLESTESPIKKLAVVMAYNAGLRPGELYDLRVGDCKFDENGDFTFVLRQRKTQRGGAQQAFNVPSTITGWTSPSTLFQVVMKARADQNHIIGDFLFMQMRNGVMTNQRIGEKSLGALAKAIADFLSLPPGNYVAYSFRRTAATALANRGASSHQLRQFMGHHSLGVATEYIDSSRHQQQSASIMLADSSTITTNGKRERPNTRPTNSHLSEITGQYIAPGGFQNCSNINITINLPPSEHSSRNVKDDNVN